MLFLISIATEIRGELTAVEAAEAEVGSEGADDGGAGDKPVADPAAAGGGGGDADAEAVANKHNETEIKKLYDACIAENDETKIKEYGDGNTENPFVKDVNLRCADEHLKLVDEQMKEAMIELEANYEPFRDNLFKIVDTLRVLITKMGPMVGKEMKAVNSNEESGRMKPMAELNEFIHEKAPELETQDSIAEAKKVEEAAKGEPPTAGREPAGGDPPTAGGGSPPAEGGSPGSPTTPTASL